MPSLPPPDPELDRGLRLIVDSYHRLTGRTLLDFEPGDMSALRMAIWNAPRAIVAHGTEADPVFFYGNLQALQLFAMDFAEFTRLSSRLSAEPMAREERARLLDQVTRQGYVDGYSGMRIAGDGLSFMIEDGTIWNLVNVSGEIHGQAAVFVSPAIRPDKET